MESILGKIGPVLCQSPIHLAMVYKPIPHENKRHLMLA